MEVRLLGPLEVVHAGVSLPLGGTKQRAVFAMLVLQANRVVPMDALIGGLWGDATPADPQNVIQVYVSRFRKLLPRVSAGGDHDSRIVRRRPGYLLRLDSDQIDLHRFEGLLREGVGAMPSASDRAASVLDEALSLWRGQPFAEFADEPFAEPEAARLEEHWLNALSLRIEANLRLGRHAQMISELESLTARFPLNEGFRGQLILSLYRCGRQADALEAYRRARTVLGEELGIEPTRELRDMEAAVLAQDPRLAWTPSAPDQVGIPPAGLRRQQAIGPITPKVWKVPNRNPYFTGRTEMLGELHRRLHGGEATLVVQALYGLGGVGKSQLVLEYAYRFAADYDLVWWIDAEQLVLIPDQLASLAVDLGLSVGPTVADTVDRLMAVLRGGKRWLLIFDNAGRPADIAGYQPGGHGHVLITSRYPAWGALGGRHEVDVLTRSETVALLRARIPTLDEGLAVELAVELGDLPLAAAQAAAYLEQTDLPPEDYLRRFRTQRATLLTRGDVLGYRGRIDTAWALSFERLRAEEPAAVQLLELAAFLAPEPVPLFLFSGQPALLPEPLRSRAQDSDALADTVGALVGYSLARRDSQGFQLHRLVQAVIRSRLAPDQQQVAADRVLALLAAAAPGNPEDPVSWDGYTQLTSHVLASAPLSDHSPVGRKLLLDVVRYLHGHGDSTGSRAVGEPLLERWRSILGFDHADTLSAASILTVALNELGAPERALTLGEDTLSRSKRVLGPDHPTTLWAAAAVTATLVGLGQFGPTRSLGEETLQRCRRLLGPDHPTTLWTAVNLTVARVLTGVAEPARHLGEDTLRRCRRVLGKDHPTTLWAAAAQTMALVGLGHFGATRDLGEETLKRSRGVLGPDHTTTLTVAAALTEALDRVGETDLAVTLGQDTLQRSYRVLGPDNPLTQYVSRVLKSGQITHVAEPSEAR